MPGEAGRDGKRGRRGAEARVRASERRFLRIPAGGRRMRAGAWLMPPLRAGLRCCRRFRRAWRRSSAGRPGSRCGGLRDRYGPRQHRDGFTRQDSRSRLRRSQGHVRGSRQTAPAACIAEHTLSQACTSEAAAWSAPVAASPACDSSGPATTGRSRRLTPFWR